jgi:hypothetical protein
MANESEVKKGKEWARQHPNLPAPAKSSQDFALGVKLQNTGK